VVPAAIYLAFNGAENVRAGWAIPTATDIAFAVGVLALLGDRIPAALKLFLLAVAIVDDLAAIAIIAVFYAGGLSAGWLLAALAGVLGVAALRRAGVTAIWPYVLAGIAVWVAVHESGVHATIAGVALGLLTPTGSIAGRDVLGVLEHRLHPVSSFVVVPLFALANAGISLDGGVLRDAASSRLAWAVVAGLVVGKCVGIAGAALIAVRLRWAQLPDGVNTGHVWGAAAIGGIGFTVSLFIAQLAYETPGTVDTAKVGIFAGSLLSGALGAALLLRQPGARSRAAHRNTSAGQVSQVMCHVRSPAEP
jgi:NhaA family Na+:H+ antiporter